MYTSPIILIHNEIIIILSKLILSNLVNKINESGFYTMFDDETTNMTQFKKF